MRAPKLPLISSLTETLTFGNFTFRRSPSQRQIVASYLIPCIIVSDVLHEDSESSLGTCVCRPVLLTSPGMCGACENDGSANGLFHILDSFLASEESSLEVDVHYLIKGLFIACVQRAHVSYGAVAEITVDPSVKLVGYPEDLSDILQVIQIHGNEGPIRACITLG